MTKRLIFVLVGCWLTLSVWAVEIHIANPEKWTSAALAEYVGQTVSFDVPMFLPYTSGTSLSPYCLATGVSSNMVTLQNAPSRERARTYSRDLKARVVAQGSTYALQYISGTFDGNTRETLLKGLDSLQIDKVGKHTLLVCAANLEYYLVKNLGTGYGPDDQKQHEAQRTKVKQALALINADIYGFCEIEQGTAALQEICNDLNAAHSDRSFTYVNNSTSASSSYTMTAFVYDANKVSPSGAIYESQAGVRNRKYMQRFVESASKEGFIFSINHFKAKTGGSDTEATRVAEANSVNSLYESYKTYCHEEDILIMGDLNAYPAEQPVTILLQDGARTDLHAYFHPEGSYSYLYGSTANYLDHAIANSTLLPQVTGMQAYHVNSDEKDCYTYDGYCNDGSMFRYSDHDPIVVGLRLKELEDTDLKVLNVGDNLCVRNGKGGYIRMYDMNGYPIQTIEGDDLVQIIEDEAYFPLETQRMMPSGLYVVHIYHNGQLYVKKYLRP